MSLNYSYILPECYVDTNLIEYLTHGNVNHQQGCNQVVGKLKKIFSDRFAIGIIDKDKVGVGYMLNCSEVVSTKHLCILRHKVFPHYLITVSPAIDRFLLDCAKEEGVSLEDFGLLYRLKEFTKQTKKNTSNKDPRFRDLIIAIKNNKEIVFLGKALNYLQANQYTSKEEDIVAFANEI